MCPRENNVHGEESSWLPAHSPSLSIKHAPFLSATRTHLTEQPCVLLLFIVLILTVIYCSKRQYIL